MSTRGRWWLRLAGAVGAIGVAALLVWALGPRAVEVEMALAEERSFERSVEDDGRARARERLVVGMPWTGELERLTWKEGQAVEPGEPLLWVRPVQPTLQDARTRAEWSARGASAQAAWQRAARQSEVALVAWQRAAVAASRAVYLAKQDFISRAQLEGHVLDLQREERSWQAALAAERAALHELELTRVMLSSWTSGELGVRRPVRATQRVQVLRVMQPHAAVLMAGAAVMEVADARHPEVVVPLLSQEALRIKPGMRVQLSGWGVSAADGPAGTLPGAAMIEGLVRVVEPAATTKVSALGLEEQRVNVVIDPSSPLPDGDGYSVRVRVLMQQEPRALCVPLSAVFPLPGDPQRQAVFTLQDGQARLTEVAVRARGGGWAWVQRGLEVGQPVVVYPPAALTDGTRVRVVQR